ncbi:hypothetical protein BH09VER1_BH09VER1_53170 [soil metagenome]
MNEPIFSTPSGVFDPTEYVTDAWLAFVRDPARDVEPLRDQIEAMLYRLLLPRTMGGFFDGFFDYIVREAVLLTLSRFLADNKKLITATQSGNRGEINLQLMRSIWLALQATMWRTRTRAIRSTAPLREEQTLGQLRQTISKLDLRTGN